MTDILPQINSIVKKCLLGLKEVSHQWTTGSSCSPGGRVLPEDLGGGVRRASGNPCLISDQNM